MSVLSEGRVASGGGQAEQAPAVTNQCPQDITHPAAALPHPLVGWGRGSPPRGATPNPAPAPRDPEGTLRGHEGAVTGPNLPPPAISTLTWRRLLHRRAPARLQVMAVAAVGRA